MSTKTIALDTRVYEKLAALKGESDSFSKVIDRLVENRKAKTVGDMLEHFKRLTPLSKKEAALMKSIVAENRKNEKWELHDLS